MRRFLFIYISIFFFSAVPLSAVFAQSFTLEPSIAISVNPADPEPGESVTATLVSYETNLSLAYISWNHAGNTKSGYGETQFSTRISNDETRTDSITASITLNDGQKIEKQVSVTPASFDIAWESLNGKAPPFYMGKKMPVRENTLRVAVIGGSGTVAYTWNRNGSALSNTGGTAKPYIDFTNTEIQKKESVTVSIVGLDKRASRSIQIPFTKGRILFYEYNPVTGLNIGRALSDTVLGYQNVISVFMVPMGINTNVKPTISWELSGLGVNNQANPYLLSFNAPTEKGEVQLAAQAKNTRSVYQEIKETLSLVF